MTFFQSNDVTHHTEGRAMDKSDKTLSLAVTLVVSLSLLATAWDLSFVSSLP